METCSIFINGQRHCLDLGFKSMVKRFNDVYGNLNLKQRWVPPPNINPLFPYYCYSHNGILMLLWHLTPHVPIELPLELIMYLKLNYL